MTYCLAIAVDEGLVFASDSRTNAGPDQVATYGKMHVFGVPGERQLVLLSAGNLATTQAVLARLKDDIRGEAPENLLRVPGVAEAAEYLGSVLREQERKHEESAARAGFNPEATFIVGGQVGRRSPRVYLVYPEGNYITTSPQTPFLQIGETKYGKAILDRIVRPETSLEDAALCALVSMDSTMRSNATVGPPIELASYTRDRLEIDRYLALAEDDPYLLEIRREWNRNITRAFDDLPRVRWEPPPGAGSSRG